MSAPRPRRNDLLAFGFILPLVAAVIGSVALWRAGWVLGGQLIWAGGAALTVTYWAVRPLRLPLYETWMGVFEPVGRVVSHLLMGIVYFGVVTPIGLLMRGVGYDPLARSLQRGPGSYWLQHRPGDDPSRYLRQS